MKGATLLQACETVASLRTEIQQLKITPSSSEAAVQQLTAKAAEPPISASTSMVPVRAISTATSMPHARALDAQTSTAGTPDTIEHTTSTTSLQAAEATQTAATRAATPPLPQGSASVAALRAASNALHDSLASAGSVGAASDPWSAYVSTDGAGSLANTALPPPSPTVTLRPATEAGALCCTQSTQTDLWMPDTDKQLFGTAAASLRAMSARTRVAAAERRHAKLSYASAFAFVDEPPERSADPAPAAAHGAAEAPTNKPASKQRLRRDRGALRADGAAAKPAPADAEAQRQQHKQEAEAAGDAAQPPQWPAGRRAEGAAWALQPQRTVAYSGDQRTVVEHAAYCPALPWRTITPADHVPLTLAVRAAMVARACATPADAAAEASAISAQARDPASAPRIFAQLESADAPTQLRSAWLHAVVPDSPSSEWPQDPPGGVHNESSAATLRRVRGGAAFERMRRELAELNELYAAALRQAAALVQVRQTLFCVLHKFAFQPSCIAACACNVCVSR